MDGTKDNDGNLLLRVFAIQNNEEVAFELPFALDLYEMIKQKYGDRLNKLNNRDKDIMIKRYGLDGNMELTQKEVAALLGISQSYISRIEKKVIKDISNLIKM